MGGVSFCERGYVVLSAPVDSKTQYKFILPFVRYARLWSGYRRLQEAGWDGIRRESCMGGIYILFFSPMKLLVAVRLV